MANLPVDDGEQGTEESSDESGQADGVGSSDRETADYDKRQESPFTAPLSI